MNNIDILTKLSLKERNRRPRITNYCYTQLTSVPLSVGSLPRRRLLARTEERVAVLLGPGSLPAFS